MKWPGRTAWKRALLLLASGIFGGVLALGGALSLIVSIATQRLTNYASEILQMDERLAQNISSTLETANHSPNPFCSDPDLELLRELLFQSPFLKDVGRVRNGQFFCSAIAGRLPKPTGIGTQHVTSASGKEIYFDTGLLVARGSRAEIVAYGQTDVVVSPTAFADFNRPPMSFTGAIVDANKKTIQQMYTSSPTPMPLDFMLSGMLMRRNSILYYPQCSKIRPDCVLTALPMHEVWRPHASGMIAAFLAGFLLGVICTSSLLVVHDRRRSLASQLRRSLRKKNLWVLYQPIVELTGGSIVGCEALVRWKDESGAIVRPDIFVGIAEEQGFVSEITRFVLDRVTTELGDTLREFPALRVSVNLSALDLTDPDFIPRLDALLAAKAIPASSIGLELTERSTADKDHVVKVIRNLQSRGHIVYIDDFGTGYSSLAYLSELSVDVLKIDRAFTKTIGTNSVTAAIVPQILEMARTLRLKVVVEGVEEEQQAVYLERWGVGIQAQGWLFGRPLTMPELRARLLNPEA